MKHIRWVHTHSSLYNDIIKVRLYSVDLLLALSLFLCAPGGSIRALIKLESFHNCQFSDNLTLAQTNGLLEPLGEMATMKSLFSPITRAPALLPSPHILSPYPHASILGAKSLPLMALIAPLCSEHQRSIYTPAGGISSGQPPVSVSRRDFTWASIMQSH